MLERFIHLKLINSAARISCLAFLGAGLLLSPVATPSPLFAEHVNQAERQKIEALIARVGKMNGVTFIRNGSSYNAPAAVRFLRQKWTANDGTVSTAREFIDKIASTSGSSGKPYLLRFQDGTVMTSREYLLKELNALETAP